MSVSVALEVERAPACAELAGVPDDAGFRRWVELALAGRCEEPVALALRVVDREEGLALNARWRGREAPTNVLSFPADVPELPPGVLPERPLGDLVLCAPVVLDEARQQAKPVEAHWAHLTIHGVLHLLGHDHAHPAEAAAMERIETELLAALGHPDPYLAEV